ncbi:MAG: hypothetical protein ACAH21_07015 [Ramlibacter sp.]
MSPRPNPFVAMLIGGLAAGVLDIIYAFALAAIRGGTPLRVLQSVASGVLGAPAYKGGAAAGILGLGLHLGICIVAAGVYCLFAQRSSHARKHVIIFGSLFGVLVYLFMNFVVLPLSAVPFKLTYPPLVLLQGFVSHALLVGLPIAWVLHRFTPPVSASP